MTAVTKILSCALVISGIMFSCRGGVNKNNDHDYDGRNERDDGSNMQQYPNDTTFPDTTNRYPIDKNDDERK